MSETTNLKLFKHDNPATNENEFNVEVALNQNWDKIDEAVGKNRQEINSELNLLSGVEEVQTLTSPATWANRSWRQASSGTGTRERITIENPPNIQFQKGWHIASTNSQVTIAQDNVPTTKNEFYMLSCYAKGTGKVYLQYGSSTVGFQNTQLEVNNEWEKYDFIFKSNGTAGAYIGVNATGYDIEICGLRLEKIDSKLKNRIDELEKEKEYLKELNIALQETVLDGQTPAGESIIVNDSVEGFGRMNIHGGQYQEKIELPNTYQRVEYIESTGTQYIDTNYFINPKTKIECEFQFTDSTIKQQRVFGSVDSANTRLDCYVKDSLQLGWNWTEQENQTNLNVNTNHTIDTNKHKIVIDGANKTVKLDDIYSSSIAGNLTKTSTTSLTIMAYVRPQAQAFAYLKLYDFKIYDNGELSRNFVACYRKSDNVAGLYDLVNDIFYENSGTGTFNVGANKNNVITPSLENSSEIKCVGDNVQLFDKKNATILNVLLQASTIKLIANSDERTLIFKCDSNTTYTISKIAGARLRVAEFENEPQINSIGKNYKDNDKGTSLEYTTSNTAQFLAIGYSYTTSSLDSDEQAIFDSIKIVKGTRVGAYSEYELGSVTLVSSNKNMFKETQNIKTETAQYKGIIYGNFCVKEGETYTVSFDTNNNSGRVYINEHIFDTNLRQNCDGKRHSITATAKQTKNFENEAVIKTEKTVTTAYNISNVQIELSNTNSNYEQHKGETLIIPIQKPFLEGDTFVRTNGNWKERHCWEKYIFDGTEIFTLQNENKRVYFRQTTNSSKLKKKPICRTTDINVNEVPFCDILTGKSPSETWKGVQGISYDSGISDDLAGLNICINGLSTVAEYQQALKNHYVWYKTRSFEYIDCTEEQRRILDKINTYKNTTIITTDDDLAKISLKYKVDVLKAIENATAVAESGG